nr:sialate O-acetylesterase [uncultured Flavobacterium sp.]
MSIKSFVFFMCFGMFTHNAWCKIILPGFVADGMVLQHDVKLPVWGWAKPNEEVTIRFQKQIKKVKTGKDGSWKIYLDPIKAGGPYQMSLEGENKILLKDILIGDVFLASGQSNMEFTTYSVKNSKDEILKADFPNIHFFRVSLNVSNKPIDTLGGKWRRVNPETVGDLSGVAYFFARDLYKKKNMPIGVIVAAWGGSVAESWTNVEALQVFPEFKKTLEDLKSGQDWHLTFTEYEKNLKAFKESNQGITFGVHQQQFADDNWSKTQFPFELKMLGLADNYGNSIWFRKQFELESSFDSKKETSLFLGKINGEVTLYVNGIKIEKREDVAEGTNFIIPQNVLKLGINQIAVKFLEIWSGNIGELGQSVRLKNDLGSTKEIQGDWKFNTKIEKTIPPYVSCNYTPSTIFNAMIAPLIPYAIKGVIWYQGESNADRAEQYRLLFPAMIEGWRKKWNSEFPFLFVQLANYMEDKKEPSDYQWAALREAQMLTLKVPKTGMAVAIDIGNVNDIHPKNKQDVGKRLALVAEKIIYGTNDIVYSGPSFEKLEVENNQIRIEYNNVGSGIEVKDKYGYVKGFAISGEDKVFKWAKGYLQGNTLILYNETIKKPTAVRYNWGNSPDGNIYNKEGLPAVPFRTDNYPMHYEKK